MNIKWLVFKLTWITMSTASWSDLRALPFITCSEAWRFWHHIVKVPAFFSFVINSLLFLVLDTLCTHSTCYTLGLSAWIWESSDCVMQRNLYAFYHSSVGVLQLFSEPWRSFKAESLQFAERGACYGSSSITCTCWSHPACSPLDPSLSKMRPMVAVTLGC